MKIRLLSDLHMEGCPFNFVPGEEDVVVLAGDIITKARHFAILDQIPNTTPVILVPGNHEYYHDDFHEINTQIRKNVAKFENVHFLFNEEVVLDGVHIFGGPMFTNCALQATPHTTFLVERCINDFRLISIDGNRWNIYDHMDQYTLFVSALEKWLQETEGEKRCVVTHFVPHELAIHPIYKGNEMNAYFTVDMDRYMGQVPLWMFGHTHASCDLEVNGTRLIANPRGYGNENPDFNRNLIVEI